LVVGEKQVPHRRFAAVRNDRGVFRGHAVVVVFRVCHSECSRSEHEEPALEVAMAKEKIYYVYIVASKSRAIYVGMTGFLMARVLRHRAGEGGAFTRNYRVHRLVYYEVFHSVGAAIARETEIKKWRREKKVEMIRAKNPTWEDLAEGWGRPALMRVTAKADSSPPLGGDSE
jgi:putative endonuclease